MNYEKEVKELLGEDAYNKFLDAVRKGQVTLQQMSDIAVELGDEVGGNFKRAQDNRNFEYNAAAARKVLSDWYQLGACEMNMNVAREKFITTLQHTNIRLNPLAAEISSIQTQTKATRAVSDAVTFVKENPANFCESAIKEIEKLWRENDQLKREKTQLQGELNQSKNNENDARMISQNDKKMLLCLQGSLTKALDENGGLRQEIEKLQDEIKDVINEIERKDEELRKKEEEIVKQRQTNENHNEALESLRTKLSLLESFEEQTANTTIGKFYKKNFNGNTQTVLKISAQNTKPMTKEAETLRRSLDHKYMVKLHESYTEDDGSTRCFLLEQLDIAYGTLADVAQQRTRNLREFAIWRFLSILSSALVYLHSRPGGPVVAHDLNPYNLVSVYRTEEERKARLVTWKILLLGTTTERVLDQEEVLAVCYPFTIFIFVHKNHYHSSSHHFHHNHPLAYVPSHFIGHYYYYSS